VTTYYVGPGGNNANNGLTWGTRKLTLNGAEDVPLVAGDQVYVGPGTYRELLTVDVSGSGGSPITYIGDYTGANTDGAGGVVRVTGSDNDQTATRANCITASSKDYRTFRGFTFDTTTATLVSLTTITNWVIEDCAFGVTNAGIVGLTCAGASQASLTVRRCVFYGNSTVNVHFTHTATVDNCGHVVENCVLLNANGNTSVRSDRIGGITVRNCLIHGAQTGARVQTALSVGQLMTVNNCLIVGCTTGLQATTTAEFSENYNTLYANATARTNVTAGANSLTYPPLYDTRWFFQTVFAGAGPSSDAQVVTPFDLASFSALLNVAGTSPPATDMRGTAVQGSQREWGPLEYDATLNVEAGGGAVAAPIFGGLVMR
jgi:hypothetical protein